MGLFLAQAEKVDEGCGGGYSCILGLFDCVDKAISACLAHKQWYQYQNGYQIFQRYTLQIMSLNNRCTDGDVIRYHSYELKENNLPGFFALGTNSEYKKYIRST